MRQQFWNQAGAAEFDVAIIGGGITGASLYHYLCQRGHRVLLTDQADFAAASSQSSGMLVWGGLLYLRNLDLRAVFRFSQARDAMIRSRADWVRPESIRYIPADKGGRSAYLVEAALYFYWAMGLFNRRLPSRQQKFAERRLIRSRNQPESLCFEEGVLRNSDARFVLHWITPHQNEEQIPLNYCAVTGGSFNRHDRRWNLHLKDTLGENEMTARARVVVNCAGVWVDEVNRIFGIKTPVKHMLSKGVYLGIARPPEHQSPLVFEMGEHGDVLTLLPWGPISLWGPTETRVDNIADGYRVNRDDINFLLDHAQDTLEQPPGRGDIVSLRCGIRPLVVPGAGEHRAHLPRQHMAPPRINGVSHGLQTEIEMDSFPGLDVSVPAARWSHRHEFCHTLPDYLRRRTNIAQWLPREGLGYNDENLAHLERIALDLCEGDREAAARQLSAYRSAVAENFDRLLCPD
ncbi:MAG: FAD-dependent oxidoreductase [Gammaproteobacteria bacterium]